MCDVRTLRRAHPVVGEDVACVRGERQRRVGGNDLSPESSLMMARVVARAGALVGELVQLFCVGWWTWSGLHIKTGSSSWKERGVLTCGVVGSVGGTSPMRSVCRACITASLSGGASWTPSIAAVRFAVAWRILSVAMMVGTGMAWWQNWNVSVMRLPPVSAIKTLMQR
jgi:hypothetical protein